jgi:O-antigen/teichoic acid export membrane protein
VADTGSVSERARSDSIARNSVFAFAAQLTGAAFTAALTLYLARALGPDGFGVFALALAVGALVVLPADLGISASAGRFIAEHRGDRPAVARLVGDALGLKIAAAVVASAALFACAPLVASAYGVSDLTWPLRAVALAIFGQSIMMLFAAAFVAEGKVAVNLRVVLSESAVETGASIALVALGTGATGAAFGRTIGYAVGAVAAAVLAARILGRAAVVPWSPSRVGLRRIARYAGALAVVDIAFSVFQQIDALLIGGFLGAASVGLFQAPMRLAALLHYPGYALATGVAPRLAEHPTEPPNVAAFMRAARYILLLQAFLVAPLVVWATPITMLLLGAEFAESAGVLRALTPYIFLAGLAPLVSLAANYLGAARRRVPIALAALAVNIGLDLVLIPTVGIEGAAIGTGAAFLLYVPAHLWICRERLGFPLRPLGRTFGRALLAAAASAAVLLAFGTGELSLAEWVGGGLAGTAVFVLVLLVLREVSPAEVRGLAGSARAGLSRP